MELRSLIQRYVPEKHSVRVLAKTGGDLVGHVLDLNHKGFRLQAKKKFGPGEMLEGLLEYDAGGTAPRLVPFTARCVWVDSREFGFSIKEIPVAQEQVLDEFIAHLAGKP